MSNLPDLKMGYLVVRTAKLDEWKRFAGEGLGLHVDAMPGGGLALRVDDYKKRLILLPGAAEEVETIGWEAETDADLEAFAANLKSHGVPFDWGDEDAADLRSVRRFLRFTGPKGMKLEIFEGPTRQNEPLRMKASGFVTGDCGIGHIAMVTKRPEDTIAFFKKILGARHTDTIEDKVQGLTLDFTFLHVNPRHHSIAVGATRGVKMDPMPVNVQHFSLEVENFSDLTAAYRRVKSMGYPIMMGIGQHPNDEATSFYVMSPSGFEFEIGWEPLQVDDATWEPQHHHAISHWGHKPENVPLSLKLGAMLRGVGSIFRSEATAWRR